MIYALIRLVNREVYVKFETSEKRHSNDMSVMMEAEQQGLISADECDSVERQIVRLNEEQFNELTMYCDNSKAKY